MVNVNKQTLGSPSTQRKQPKKRGTSILKQSTEWVRKKAEAIKFKSVSSEYSEGHGGDLDLNGTQCPELSEIVHRLVFFLAPFTAPHFSWCCIAFTSLLHWC